MIPQSKLLGIMPFAMRDCSTYKFQYTYSDPMVPFRVFRLFAFEI
jgi:hypothetical protein